MKAFAPVLSIAAIIALEVVAIAHGMNGTTLAAAIAALGGIGGYTARGLVARRGETRKVDRGDAE